MKNNETVGDRIREVRGEMAQIDFAKLVDIGRTTLIRYEKNERPPDAEFLIRINVLFGVHPLWLLTGTGDTKGGVQLTPHEASVIEQYRVADEQGKYAVDSILKAVTKTGKKK